MTRTPDWIELAPRPSMPLSSRTRLTSYSPMLGAMLAEVADELTRPFAGIVVPSTHGTTTATDAAATAVDTAPIVDAAEAFLASLDADRRQRAMFPVDAVERRQWFNVHPNVMRHGLLLEDLSAEQRQLAMGVVSATLSSRGFRQARDIMRINALLVDVTGKADDFGEWPYFFSLFGPPDRDQPWAWQLDGHHLNLNALVVHDRLALTPSFMGSEPCSILHGPLAGMSVLGAEAEAGLALMRSLDPAQLAIARPVPSILRDEIPPGLSHPIDGRMVAGAFKDNITIEHAGIGADALGDAQRSLLLSLVGTYVGWGREDHAHVRMTDIAEHLDDTSLVWMGSLDDDGPFYYRVLSPVVLLEFDHHPGIVFDNVEPSRHHVHTVLRTPNRGDYGADLLARHHERYDHRHGHHDRH